jgi:hypothetical protein
MGFVQKLTLFLLSIVPPFLSSLQEALLRIFRQMNISNWHFEERFATKSGLFVLELRAAWDAQHRRHISDDCKEQVRILPTPLGSLLPERS